MNRGHGLQCYALANHVSEEPTLNILLAFPFQNEKAILASCKV